MIVPVEVTGLIGGSSATFGAPVELNLGGRGIRSIEKASDGSGYLIIAVLLAQPLALSPTTLGFLHGDGRALTVTELNNDLDSLLSSTSGSFETIAGLTSINTGTAVEHNSKTTVIRYGAEKASPPPPSRFQPPNSSFKVTG